MFDVAVDLRRSLARPSGAGSACELTEDNHGSSGSRPASRTASTCAASGRRALQVHRALRPHTGSHAALGRSRPRNRVAAGGGPAAPALGRRTPRAPRSVTRPPIREPHRARAALITGAGGQLGRALLATAPPEWRIVACGSDRARRDATRPWWPRVLERERPAVVFHAAAYTAVDAAESHAERAEAVNAAEPAHVAGPRAEVGRPADPRLHRLRLRRRAGPSLRAGRPAQPARRLWPHQVRASARSCGCTGGAGADRPHRLALRRARPQLRPHHAPPDAGARRGRRGGRPGRARPPGPARWRGRSGPRRGARPAGHPPLDRRRRRDLV